MNWNLSDHDRGIKARSLQQGRDLNDSYTLYLNNNKLITVSNCIYSKLMYIASTAHI